MSNGETGNNERIVNNNKMAIVIFLKVRYKKLGVQSRKDIYVNIFMTFSRFGDIIELCM